jgi:hypothetical protein
MTRRLWLRRHDLEGGAILVSPPARPIITDALSSPRPSASANTEIIMQLAVLAGTRYNTLGLERPLLWPVLPRPSMAGFEVSTEAIRINTTDTATTGVW